MFRGCVESAQMRARKRRCMGTSDRQQRRCKTGSITNSDLAKENFTIPEERVHAAAELQQEQGCT
jgi:hypothetical protein